MTGGLPLLLLLLALPADAAAPIPVAEARAVFEQARRLCERDGGRLWGASLCAPIMLVEPRSRAIVASAPDAAGVLEERGDVFVGTLPDGRNAANTAVE